MIINNRRLIIFFFIFAILMVSSSALAWVWNQKHLDYGGCANTCHNLHGSALGDSLLVGSDTESTCRGCHGVAGPGPEAAIHDPLNVGIGNMGYITCRECHDSYHDEDSVAGGDNVKMVGYDWDPIVDPGKSNVFPNANIRVELSTTNPIDPPVYKSVVFKSRSTDFSRGDFQGVCQTCHNTSAPAGPPSGSSTDLNNHQWGDCTSCHLHSEGFAKLQCVDCHDVNFTVATTAPKVVDKNGASTALVGAHFQSTTGEVITGLADVDWTVQCIKCHTGHSGDVLIPNNASVGIDYQKTGGIGLGGSATTATTEAEICWDCHSANGVSEWNGFAYNGYAVSSANWVSAVFDAAGTRIPNRATVSMHTANDIDSDLSETNVRASSVEHNVDTGGRTSNHAGFTGAKVLEQVGYIRCSYCHDVHNTFGPDKGDTLNMGGTVSASTGGAGTKVIAPTYLRGSWMENPYYARGGGVTTAEIPPENTRHTGNDYFTNNKWQYGSNNRWGTVTTPRLIANTAGSSKEGGFFIDQNSGWPTRIAANSYVTVEDSAGLCVLCHGNDVDNMDYYPNSSFSLWNGAENGHGNSTLGGSGRDFVGNNIFDARLRNGTDPGMTGHIGYMGGQGFDSPNQSRWGDGSNRWQNYLPWGASSDKYNGAKPDDNNNGIPVQNTGWYNWAQAGAQRTSNSAQLRGGDFANWYSGTAIGADGLDNVRAHNFTCSKCHTPHASGLPALLMTNCLDYGVSNWVRNANVPLGPTNTGTTTKNRVAQQVMNNCHRKSTTSAGWNTLAPQQ